MKKKIVRRQNAGKVMSLGDAALDLPFTTKKWENIEKINIYRIYYKNQNCKNDNNRNIIFCPPLFIDYPSYHQNNK